MKRFFLILVALVLLWPAAPALADGTYCWCRNPAFVCTRDQANGILPGGVAGGSITTEQCNAFCADRSSGTRSIHLDVGDNSAAICLNDCTVGGTCVPPLLAGIPSLNTCIANGVVYRDVTTLDRCCQYLRADGSSGAGVVGYNGGPQACIGEAVPGEVVPSTTVIRLFNPLGSDLDIPAFIGRGIRGVLGVIGAIALLMFVYGGVTWMTAGDSERVGNAKNIIKNSIIGLLLIFFSYNLIGIFFDFFT